MSSEPTLWSSLGEHWQFARRLRYLKIHLDPEKCRGVWECFEVCPVNCWTVDHTSRKVIFHDPERCIACNACVLQCPEGAIELN